MRHFKWPWVTESLISEIFSGRKHRAVSLRIFDNNFDKCGPIFNILSPTDSWVNSLRTNTDCHLTCNMLLTTSWKSKVISPSIVKIGPWLYEKCQRDLESVSGTRSPPTVDEFFRLMPNRNSQVSVKSADYFCSNRAHGMTDKITQQRRNQKQHLDRVGLIIPISRYIGWNVLIRHISMRLRAVGWVDDVSCGV